MGRLCGGNVDDDLKQKREKERGMVKEMNEKRSIVVMLHQREEREETGVEVVCRVRLSTWHIAVRC